MKLIAFFTIIICAISNARGLTASREGKQVVIRDGKHEILRYQAEPEKPPSPEIPEAYRRGGYLQSIHSPAGKMITDDFAPNHLHHHGVWAAWTKTEFDGRQPDFWNMGEKTGRVEFVALDQVWEKGDSAGFQARHRYVDLTVDPPKTVLLETWEITVSSSAGVHVIDLAFTQTCASDTPLKLPLHHYGGLGFRGNRNWNGKENCRFLTSAGLKDRTAVNTSRDKWCWIGGDVDGATCGVTILCHPANFRFPQPIRAHPNEPFFCYAPQQAGEMQITPSDKYLSRYRLIVADGEPVAAVADAAWEDFSKGR